MPDLRSELRRVEQRLTELREDLAAKAQTRTEARDSFLRLPEDQRNTTDSEEYKSVERAVAEHGRVADEIHDLEGVQIGLLKTLGQDPAPSPNGNGNGHVEPADWLTDELVETFKTMAGSRGKFGQLDLGEIVSRDELVGIVQKADLTGTANLRRATFGGVVPMARRRLTLLDLISQGTMDGQSLPYVQEGGTYNAAETTEGQAKPEAGITLTDAQADAATIAHWKKILKQSLEDSAAIRSIVDSHLRYGVLRRLEGQIIAGNGTPPNLRGILNTSGIQTQAFAAGPVATMLLQAIAKVFIAEGEADGITLNPVDWANALTEREGGASGAYLLGGNAAATGSPGFDTPTLWGVPAIPNANQPAGHAIVGDWSMGATLLIRSGVRVLMSDSDQDDFIRNRITLLGEMRAALAVWRPAMFVDADIVTP